MRVKSGVAFCTKVSRVRHPGAASGPECPPVRGGFTLIELLIVVVIIGVLASIAIPRFDEVRQRAYNSTALSDIKTTSHAIEEYFTENLKYPTQTELEDSGFTLSPGVSFRTYSVRDASNPAKTRIHMHVEHVGSLHYFHQEYPGSKPPEKRWK